MITKEDLVKYLAYSAKLEQENRDLAIGKQAAVSDEKFKEISAENAELKAGFSAMSSTIEELRKYIAEIEQKIADIPVARDGKDGEQGPAGPQGEHGRDGVDGHSPSAVEIADQVVKHATFPSLLTKGEKGDGGPQGPQGERGERGVDGYSPSAVEVQLAFRNDPTFMSALPVGPQGPQGDRGERGERGADGIDGRDGMPGLQGERGADGINGKDGAPGERGERGADGINGRDGVDGINGRDGSSGIDGRDGKDGRDGRDGADGVFKAPVMWQQGKHASGTLATHKNGLWYCNTDTDAEPGEKHWNLLSAGITNVTFRKVGDRGIECRSVLTDGSTATNVVEFPVPIYRGTFDENGAYEQGDMVTQSGSVWHADKDKLSRPSMVDSGWKLAVKRGSDGKDAKPVVQRQTFYSRWAGKHEAGDHVQHGAYTWLCLRQTHEAPPAETMVDNANWIVVNKR